MMGRVPLPESLFRGPSRSSLVSGDRACANLADPGTRRRVGLVWTLPRRVRSERFIT